MEFTFTEAEEAFRKEVRAFIAQHVTPEVIAEQGGDEESGRDHPHTDAMIEKMMERGWVRMAMPKIGRAHV